MIEECFCMKKVTTILFHFLLASSFAQGTYKASIDLTMVDGDKVPVEILVPQISDEEIEYQMPKIVPGTYSISDFGRFLIDFKPLDIEGNTLEYKKISTNRWLIKGADKLHKITYWVEDSFDDFNGYGRNKLFEPGGMSIEEEKEVYVINTFGFVGYLENKKFNPFELTITHSEKIKGATSLKKINETPVSDTYSAINYNFLADAPLMYCRPDIVSKEIAGANITVSVYSPNNILTAKDVMENIDELMEAQAKYLGGELPVDRYTYLIYLTDKGSLSGLSGALEHSYSSMYVLPELPPQYLNQTIRDVAAHEFFHIVTPLNIHSEEIHDFNYIEPEMSRHLWLYEGVTEYASHHVQVQYGLYELGDFLDEIKNKMIQQEKYKVDIPYTEFSENILEPKNERKYGDVYAGGALIAMCLDLTIIKSSEGSQDLQSLLRGLSEDYGPLKPFKDEELFDEIEKRSTPEVGRFLRKHVGGTEPLPFKQVMDWAGIEFSRDVQNRSVTAGNFTMALNDNREIYVAETTGMNEFGRRLGLEIVWKGG